MLGSPGQSGSLPKNNDQINEDLSQIAQSDLDDDIPF